MTITGAILAGGKSSRMGEPKAGVRLWDGRTMLDYVITALRPVCQQLVVVGDNAGVDLSGYSGLIHLVDRNPGCGPLAGLEALFESRLDHRYLVVSCDQPLLTPALLQMLVAAASDTSFTFFKGDSDELFDPFPGIYPSCWLTEVRQYLAQKSYALRPALKREDIRWVPISPSDSRFLESINTPEQVRRIMDKPSKETFHVG